MNYDDDPFKSLQEDLEKLHELDNDAIQQNLSAESFADLDSEVVTSASFSNDDDIRRVGNAGRRWKTRWKRCKTFPCSVRARTKFAPLY